MTTVLKTQPYLGSVAAGMNPDTRGPTPRSGMSAYATPPNAISPISHARSVGNTPIALGTGSTPIPLGPSPILPPTQHMHIKTPTPAQFRTGTPNLKMQSPMSPTQEMGTIPHLQTGERALSRTGSTTSRPSSRFSIQVLKQTDGIIPGQYGTNRYASRKGMTEYGAPRDVRGKHFHRLIIEDPTFFSREDQLMNSDAIIPGQYGTNRFASRKGMTEYGAPRDVKGKHYHRLLEDDPDSHFREDTLRQSDAIIPGQYGTNRFASRKGMTEYGASRDVHGKHFHRLIDEDDTQRASESVMRQSDAIIGGQYGTNRFESRKGMTEYGAARDVKGKHVHRLLEDDPNLPRFDETTLRQTDSIIGGQYGSNRFASRKGMTEYGAPRDVKGLHYHNLLQDDQQDLPHFPESKLRETDGIIPGQYGTNRYASRKGMTEYGAPRDVRGSHIHRAWEEDDSFQRFPEQTLRISDAVIPGQYGTNKFDSQRGMTKFGTPRDVAGTHLHNLLDEYSYNENMVI